MAKQVDPVKVCYHEAQRIKQTLFRFVPPQFSNQTQHSTWLAHDKNVLGDKQARRHARKGSGRSYMALGSSSW